METLRTEFCRCIINGPILIGSPIFGDTSTREAHKRLRDIYGFLVDFKSSIMCIATKIGTIIKIWNVFLKIRFGQLKSI